MASARSASVSFYVGAGSQYERDELAGVSHLVEHCVFKGSELHPSAADISTAIEGVGGYINAGTDRELTVYYAKVPGPDWETAVDVVVDMVCRPRFDRDELEKERSVILEELAQIEDSPYQLVGELMAEVMWRDTPLGRDIAGTPESVNGIPYEDTVSYWRSQYSPGNTLVSVAGEIDPDAVLARVTALTERWAPAQADDRRAAPLSTAGDRVELDGEARNAFPLPEQLAHENADNRLLGMKLGLKRAPNIVAAARSVSSGGLDLHALRKESYDSAKRGIRTLPGVGNKIADCIALFSLDKLEAFPVDVHIGRALSRWPECPFPQASRGLADRQYAEIVRWAQDNLGPYAGYAGQFLFCDQPKRAVQ